LKSISEGVRTIVTVTERLSDLHTEVAALRSDLHRLAEVVYRIVGRLGGIEQRFSEVDKRTDLAMKLAVREELDRRADPQRNDRASFASAGRPALAIIHLPRRVSAGEPDWQRWPPL
jgi:hypothetical protein